MSNMPEENKLQPALLSYKNEIRALAQALKAALEMDVVVVDRYLNRIVNTFQYHYNSGNIRINSVVGNIVMTQKLQMIYDRKYFTDCVNCPDYTTCELGGVFGTPIMCGEECIGAIALLAGTNQVVSFQKRQAAMMAFLQQVAVLIAEMVQNGIHRSRLEEVRSLSHTLLDMVDEGIAITDSAGVISFENHFFRSFFAEGNENVGSRIDEIFSQWTQRQPKGEHRSLIDNQFYKKGQEIVRLRGIYGLDEEKSSDAALLYVFDRVDTAPFFRSQTQTSRALEKLELFFGKSQAMERARQNAVRALHNQLSILVECPDRKQADELAKILSSSFAKGERQVVKVDCSEEEEILEAVLLGRKDEFPSILSLTKESVLYLYGIDYLPLYLQKRLTRFLNSNWDDDENPSRVRIVATSSQSLYSLVEKKRFSITLYNYVAQNKISIPEINGVPEDIRFYFEKYLNRYCDIYQRTPVRIGEEAWGLLEKCTWKEGVQKIRETAELVAARLEGDELTPEQLARFLPGEELRPQRRGMVENTIESQLRELLRAGMTKEKIAEKMGVSRATLYRWIDKFKLNG